MLYIAAFSFTICAAVIVAACHLALGYVPTSFSYTQRRKEQRAMLSAAACLVVMFGAAASIALQGA